MKSVFAIAALAGLAASSASAQNLTISFSASATSVTSFATVTWTMTASWTGGMSDADYFGAVNAHLVGFGTAGGTASPMTGLSWANPALGALLTGTADGTSLKDVFAAQQDIWGHWVPGNPFTIGSFEVTYNAAGSASYGVASRDDNPVFAVFYRASPNDFFDPPVFYNPDEVTLITDTVTVTPAPSVLTLLGLGGLMACRRGRPDRLGTGAQR